MLDGVSCGEIVATCVSIKHGVASEGKGAPNRGQAIPSVARCDQKV